MPMHVSIHIIITSNVFTHTKNKILHIQTHCVTQINKLIAYTQSFNKLALPILLKVKCNVLFNEHNQNCNINTCINYKYYMNVFIIFKKKISL